VSFYNKLSTVTCHIFQINDRVTILFLLEITQGFFIFISDYSVNMLLLFLISILITSTACAEIKCHPPSGCSIDTDCVNNTCVCNFGWSGTFCQTRISDDYPLAWWLNASWIVLLYIILGSIALSKFIKGVISITNNEKNRTGLRLFHPKLLVAALVFLISCKICLVFIVDGISPFPWYISAFSIPADWTVVMILYGCQVVFYWHLLQKQTALHRGTYIKYQRLLVIIVVGNVFIGIGGGICFLLEGGGISVMVYALIQVNILVFYISAFFIIDRKMKLVLKGDYKMFKVTGVTLKISSITFVLMFTMICIIFLGLPNKASYYLLGSSLYNTVQSFLLATILFTYFRVDFFTKYMCFFCLTDEEMDHGIKSPYKTSSESVQVDSTVSHYDSNSIHMDV
jgi:hypothetical protein